MIFCDAQLDFLLWLKGIRSPILDPFFLFMNWLDTGYFYYSLIAFVWLGFSRKWGIRSAYLISIVFTLCALAKTFFALPRPCHFIEHLCMVSLKSHGFPSGGAVSAVLLSGLLALFWKNRLAWPIATAYFFLMSLSRLYLGIHFPVDILGGWILGAISLWGFYLLVEPIENAAKKHLKAMTILSIAIPLLLWAVLVKEHRFFGLGAMAGIGVGIWASRYFDHIPRPPRTVWVGILRGLFGIASTTAVFLATRNSFLTYLWVSWLGSIAFI